MLTAKVSRLVRQYSSSVSALGDIKILDLTRIVAGPFCTMILGDLGATVYKVEALGSGDECRNWPPNINNIDGEMSCYFASVNRNKKSICVDFKTQEGLNILYELSQKCDVLIENFIPGKLDKMGLGYEQMNKLNPKLIYCSVSGYGVQGPYRDRPGYDNIAASVGGLFHITGPRDGEPCKVGVAITDIATGLYAHGAIIAALYQRSKTGVGQKVDVNLLSTQVACLINIGSNYLNAGKEAVRWGTEHESIVVYQALKTRDGYVTLGTGSNAQFKAFCQLLKLDKLLEDSRFSTNALRVQNREALLAIVKPYFLTKTTKEVVELLQGAPFPFGPVNNMKQVFEDPHIKEIGLVEEVTLKTGATIKVVGPPVEYSDSTNAIRSPPPSKGEHTKEILSSLLHYSDDKINNLFLRKIIE